ncbi:MAG: hypothetical protein B6D73_10785 [gamma proteobacterium symbiont of Stewartia floridana]|nr:MAG: hypothetical protein B6D73_10785 [gamma proteobacterium symbiont of Stewartia floridana]
MTEREELLGEEYRPIAYYKVFADLAGCVKAALLLSQALYWSPRSALEGGWFWKSMKEWEEETGLTRYELQGARKKLVALGFMDETRKGRRPGTDMHYRVNVQVIQDALRETVGR